jgi:ADP-heptose:LPS heptosyltransferase
MQGNGTIVNDMLLEMNAQNVAGFFNEQCYVNNDLFIKYPVEVSEIDRHLSLIANLEIDLLGRYLEFPLSEPDHAELALLNQRFENGRYICIHPGSRGPWRQWPVQYFAELADYCLDSGFEVVLTGIKQECNIVKQVEDRINRPVINLSGKTTLGAVGVLIKNAALLIANCTGVSHMASAFGTPSVIISMDGEPERWGPLNRNLHKVIDWTKDPGFEKVLKITHQIIKEMGRKPVYPHLESVGRTPPFPSGE